MDIKQEIKEFRDRWYSHDKALLAHKRSYVSLEDLEENLESSQFAIDLDGYHFECLFKEQAGEYLYVSYITSYPLKRKYVYVFEEYPGV